jgi:AraC-like DNA-binding protein
MINLLTVSCSFLLLIFSIKLIITKSENKYINIIFASIIIGRMVGLNFVFLAAENASLIQYPFLLKIFNPYYYLIPSGMYLYIRGILNQDSRFQMFDIVHFLPFIFGFIDITYYFNHQQELLYEVKELVTNQDKYFFYYISGPLTSSLKNIVRPALFSFYIILILKLIIKKIPFKSPFKFKTEEKWVLILLIYISIAHFLELVQWYNHFIGDRVNYYNNDTRVFIILPVLLLLGIVLFIFQNPDILYGHMYVMEKWQSKRDNSIEMALNTTIPEIVNQEIETTTEESKESKEMIPYSLALEYVNLLVMTMKEKKLYQQHDLQIIELANETNILVHHCSYVLNKVLGKNFRDWTNDYRVSHFIDIYKEQRTQKTIDAIAKESGFKNTTTFYNAFKKATGLSPTQYFR